MFSCIAESLIRSTMRMGNIKYHKIAAFYHFSISNLKRLFGMCLGGRLAHLDIVIVYFKIREMGLKFRCGIGKNPNKRTSITVSLRLPTLDCGGNHEVKVPIAPY